MSLEPNSGACNTRPVLRGAGFPANALVSIFTKRTTPPSETGSQIAEATADAVGAFAVTLPTIGPDCDARTPSGWQYTITAAAVGGGTPPWSSAVFTATNPPDRQSVCFAETGQCIRGPFLDYWQANGGLARNGYPLTDERREVLEDGKEYTVQYFERVRLEYHPENEGTPYAVLLGQFGRRILSAAYAEIRDYRLYQQVTAPADPIPGQAYFPETGHNLGGRFLAYWRANGGLAQFGYPITEERSDRLEDGNLYVTQYFERGRLEYHPENAGTPYEVLLGQFGREILRQNALLSGDFAQLYFATTALRERLGAPTGPVVETPGAAQLFERGRMLWRGDRRWIYVLSGTPEAGTLLQEFIFRTHFEDAWTEGQPVGGGPAPTEPGRYLPRRGFYKVWREHEAVRAGLGYAATPNEVGYTMRVQEFDGGLLISSDMPEGRYVYAIYIQRTSNSGSPIIQYQRFPAR